MLYTIIILIAGVLISVFNCVFFLDNLNVAWWQISLITFAYIASVIIIDAIIALFINKLPKKWFDNESFIFKTYKWEKKFYEKLGIKKWKDKIPELGSLGNFSKSKIENPNSSAYIKQFIIESKVGECVHFLGMIFGFLLLIVPNFRLFIALPVSIINVFMNIPSLLILRYNRPKLGVLLQRAIRVEQRMQQTELSKAS